MGRDCRGYTPIHPDPIISYWIRQNGRLRWSGYRNNRRVGNRSSTTDDRYLTLVASSGDRNSSDHTVGDGLLRLIGVYYLTVVMILS